MFDAVAKRLWNALYKDFSRIDPAVEIFGRKAYFLLNNEGFPSFRKHIFPALDDSLSVSTFRYCTQLKHMFDRCISPTDVHQQKDLDVEALGKFVIGQSNVISKLPDTKRCTRLCNEITRVLGLILGEVPDIQALIKWNVPSKASVGVTREDSYLHEKLNNLSGTTEQHLVLDKMLGGCAWGMKRILSSHVTVTAVEKKWNKSRLIAADTVAGGIITNAIGNHITDRLLKSVGICIKTQQHKHRRLMKPASLYGKLATLDLSAASDSFSIPLMERILSPEWFYLLFFIRNKYATVSSEDIELKSFMLMGVGITFPLQTAIFYAIIQSVKNLLRSTMPHDFGGIISVYGDDCVFPTSLYPYVVTCMQDLGFTVNTEKSFSTGFFRESCGEDCYKGCSVRPAFLKWKFSDPVCNLYSFMNNLFRRFNVIQIPETYRLLLATICFLDTEVFIVPPSYPDYAGLHVDHPRTFQGMTGELISFSYVTFFSYLDSVKTVALHRKKNEEELCEGYEFKCKTIKTSGMKLIPDSADHRNYLSEALREKIPPSYFKHGWILDQSNLLVYDIHCHSSEQSIWKKLSPKNKNKGFSTTMNVKKKRRSPMPKRWMMLVPVKEQRDNHLLFKDDYSHVPWWA